jgi:hypothetical protein
LLLVAEALDEEVSWHSPLRFTVAASIARGMLSGANAEANERILYEQRPEWNEKRLDLCHSIYKAFLWREASVKSDWSGRGGAAVWRAHRRVEQQDFENWLMRRSRDNSPVERHVRPPGWLVRSPNTWRTCVIPTWKTEVPERFSRWLATGRLLAFPAQERQVLWPLTPIPDPPGWETVPGIEPVINAAKGLRPHQISGFIEAVLVDWGSDDAEHRDSVGPVRIPSSKALDFGFIDLDEYRRAMAGAREATRRRMIDVIKMLNEHEHRLRAELTAAMGNAGLFAQMASRRGIEFSAVKATWTWPRRSLADEVLAGTRGDAVEWLAGWFHRTCIRTLQRSMDQAWHAAFDHHSAAYWHPKRSCDTDQYRSYPFLFDA